MFSTLRQGSPVFVIFKNGPRVATAKVAQMSAQYPPQMNYIISQNPAGISAMFDLTLELDGKTETFPKVPTTSSVADFPDKGIVLSETRDGVISEINAMMGAANSEIEKMPYYEQTVANCKQILLDINPELKRGQEQAAEIAALKQQMAGMSGQLETMSALLAKALGKKTKEE